MSFSIKQLGRALNLRDGSPLITMPSGMGVDYQLLTPYKATLNLSGATLAVTEALDYGSLLVATWPDRNIHILGMEVDLVLVKGGVTNGLEAAVDLDMGMGSTAASAQTLATTMIDYLEKQDVDADALSVDLEVNVLGQSTATFPKQLADAAANKLYLNCGVPAGITADDALTVTGQIDLYFIDLGNRTS
jgi:hypothetical protein